MTKPPDRFLFMKVGNHANESWNQILERKRKEYETTGHIFWGYGGTTCHPLGVVQPFARLSIREQGGIALVMEAITSRADPDIVPAKEFSRDGIAWEPIPDGISVTGSRYALVLDEIKPGDLAIQLNEFEVALGPSAGKAAETYITGHIDKRCFIRSKQPREVNDEKKASVVRRIGFTAELKEPFGVLLR
jgi:hypothetical protein